MDILDEAEQHCARAGARLTPLRKRVLEVLVEADAPVKAYDLMARLDDSAANAKPPTVYRALDFLMQTGLVHKVEALNAFVACPSAGHGAAAILYVCEKCGRITEVHGTRPGQDKRPAGFVVKRSVVEHYGLCAGCAA